jgi:hypothetical protein
MRRCPDKNKIQEVFCPDPCFEHYPIQVFTASGLAEMNKSIPKLLTLADIEKMVKQIQDI